MNLETGVISVSSLSMGACAAAGPATMARVLNAMSASMVTRRFIESSSSRLHFSLLALQSLVPLRLSPGPRTLDSAAPSVVGGLARGGRHGRGEAAPELPARAELSALPEPGADTGQIGRADPRSLRDHRAQHLDVEEVGLELAKE